MGRPKDQYMSSRLAVGNSSHPTRRHTYANTNLPGKGRVPSACGPPFEFGAHPGSEKF